MDVKEEETLISLKASPLFKHATRAEFNAVEIPHKASLPRALFQNRRSVPGPIRP